MFLVEAQVLAAHEFGLPLHHKSSHDQEDGDGKLDQNQNIAKAGVPGSGLIAAPQHFDGLDRSQEECRIGAGYDTEHQGQPKQDRDDHRVLQVRHGQSPQGEGPEGWQQKVHQG